MLLGIDIFLATSLMTCIFERYFPSKLSYLYQLLGLAGFGQLLVTHEFMAFFPSYTRFWYSFVFSIFAVVNVIVLNAYVFFIRKAKKYGKFFSIVVTAPTTVLLGMFLSSYTAEAPHPLFLLPAVPVNLLFFGVFLFDTLVISTAVYALVKPKRIQLVILAITVVIAAAIFAIVTPIISQPAFIVGSVALFSGLGIACIGILGASIYVLLRFLRVQSRGKGGEM